MRMYLYLTILFVLILAASPVLLNGATSGQLLQDNLEKNLSTNTRATLIINGVFIELEISGLDIIKMELSERSPGNVFEGYSGTITNNDGMYSFDGVIFLNGEKYNVVNEPLLIYFE